MIICFFKHHFVNFNNIKYFYRSILFFMKLDIRLFQLDISPKTFRIGILTGFIIYSIFGFLDIYMLPVTYKFAWMVRFYLLGPILIIPFILSYFTKFHSKLGFYTIMAIIFAQIGLLVIIFNSQAEEKAYYDYFLGLILVILWAAFIFRVNYRIIILISLFTGIVYIYHMIVDQQLLSFGDHSEQYATFIYNVLFFISIGFLAIIGSFLLDDYHKIQKKETKEIQDALNKSKESDQIKTSFLNTMSHEIRTPLNGIIGFSEILMDEPDTSDLEEIANIINRQGYHLLEVLTNILEFSELQNKSDLGHKELIEIETFLENIQDVFEKYKLKFGMLSSHLKIHLDPYLENSQLFVQYPKFQSAVNAILENAIKFGDNGMVKMSLDIVETTGLIISVEDKGIGLAEKQSESVFQNFRQVDQGHNRPYQGIGMGLSISKKIIQFMQGSIWYKKNHDQGTTFFIHIPNCIKKSE